MPRSRSLLRPAKASRPVPVTVSPELTIELIDRKTGKVVKTTTLPDPRDAYCWTYNKLALGHGGDYFARPASE